MQKIFKPNDIKRIRKNNHVSQAVFAAFLGTGKTTVQQWEQGIKKPSGPAQRLLDIISRRGLVILCQ
jgi:putative transcriptional regulator